MPTIVVQATNLQGKTVEGARWEIDPPPGLQEGQSMAVSVRLKDKALERFLSRPQNQSPDCLFERDPEGASVSLSFTVKRVRHMVAPPSRAVETLCLVVPANRNVEQVLAYLMTPSKANANFVRAVRGSGQD